MRDELAGGRGVARRAPFDGDEIVRKISYLALASRQTVLPCLIIRLELGAKALVESFKSL